MHTKTNQPMTPSEMTALQSQWQKNPVSFSKNVVGGNLWQKQQNILESVRDHRFTAVRSGHGVGKTHVSAHAILWWLFSFFPSKVITTAPTWTQVENVLWKEIGRLYSGAKVPLGGRLKKTALDLESEDWFAIGLSTDEAERFQGFHSPNLLVVFDEAPGVSPIIWEAALGLMTGEHNHFLAIGNPISPSGPFYDAFQSSLYNKIRISCLDNPNYIEGKEVIPGLTTRQWVEDRKREWGEQSPLYMSRVLGEFPIEGINTLIPLSWCIDACNKSSQITSRDKYLGVDVARYGDDNTVIVMYQAPIIRTWTLKQKDTMYVANFIVRLFNEERPNMVVVDDTGLGGGVTDRLQELRIPTVGVNFSEAAQNNSLFRGVRDEMFWELREMFRTGKIVLDRGRDTLLINQLSSIQYKIMERSGKVQIESKEAMKKRGLPSPNDADALALAVYGSQKLFRMAGVKAARGSTGPKMDVEEIY